MQTITASNTKWQILTEEEYIAMQNLTQQMQKELKNAVQNKENQQGPIGEKIAIIHKMAAIYLAPIQPKGSQ